MPLPSLPFTFPDAASGWRRIVETVNNILNFRFDDSRIRTVAEIAAGVMPTNFAYAPGDVRRYGADATGMATSDTALANAIAVCGTSGGVIQAPAGTYTFASAINLNQKNAIIIQGDGSQNSGAQPGTKFTYTGTGTGTWITMQSANGCKLVGIQLAHSSASFTGTYLSCNNDGTHGDPQNCGTFDCNFGANVGTGTTHLNLDKCIIFTAERCTFQYGNPSIQGQAHAGSSYSNVIRFRDCTWLNNYVAPVQDLGQAWLFDGCTFEALTTGAPGAMTTNGLTTFASGLIVKACWFGDATTTVGTWISGYLNGAVFEGNYISGNQTASTGFSLSAPSGVVIKGNVFSALLTALDFASGGGGGHGVEYAGNFFTSVTNQITNAANTDIELVFNPNSPQIAPPTGKGAYNNNGYVIFPGGIILQWGTVAVTTNTPAAVTFPLAFPTTCFSVVPGFEAQSGANSVAATAITTSGFTANVGGTAGANTVSWVAVGK